MLVTAKEEHSEVRNLNCSQRLSVDRALVKSPGNLSQYLANNTGEGIKKDPATPPNEQAEADSAL